MGFQEYEDRFQKELRQAKIKQELLFCQADLFDKRGKPIQAHETRVRARVLGYLWGIDPEPQRAQADLRTAIDAIIARGEAGRASS